MSALAPLPLRMFSWLHLYMNEWGKWICVLVFNCQFEALGRRWKLGSGTQPGPVSDRRWGPTWHKEWPFWWCWRRTDGWSKIIPFLPSLNVVSLHFLANRGQEVSRTVPDKTELWLLRTSWLYRRVLFLFTDGSTAKLTINTPLFQPSFSLSVYPSLPCGFWSLPKHPDLSLDKTLVDIRLSPDKTPQHVMVKDECKKCLG